MLNADSTLLRNGRVLGSDIAGEFVLLDQDNGQYYGFDSVASEIWRRLEQPIKVSELSAHLIAHFDGDPADIGNELHKFLQALLAEGLVTVLDDAPGSASAAPSAS